MLPHLIRIHLAFDSLVEGKSNQGNLLRGLEMWHLVMRASEYCNLRCCSPSEQLALETILPSNVSVIVSSLY